MADEIENANVVRVVKEGNQWLALIGPDLQSGLSGSGPTAIDALSNLITRCMMKGWPFDSTWKPNANRI